MKTTKLQPTLQQNYTNMVDQVIAELNLLRDKMEAHKERQANDPKNWGYLGDAGEVLSRLKDINEFMGQ